MLFYVLAIGLADLAHLLTRRFWVGVLLGSCAGGLVAIFSEIASSGLSAKPNDILFWLPMTIFVGALITFPISLMVGALSLLVRKRHLPPHL
jgi:hypothetical protein